MAPRRMPVTSFQAVEGKQLSRVEVKDKDAPRPSAVDAFASRKIANALAKMIGIGAGLGAGASVLGGGDPVKGAIGGALGGAAFKGLGGKKLLQEGAEAATKGKAPVKTIGATLPGNLAEAKAKGVAKAPSPTVSALAEKVKTRGPKVDPAAVIAGPPPRAPSPTAPSGLLAAKPKPKPGTPAYGEWVRGRVLAGRSPQDLMRLQGEGTGPIASPVNWKTGSIGFAALAGILGL